MAQVKIPPAKLWDGRVLKKKREKLKLSLLALSNLIGIDDDNLRKYEKNMAIPLILTLRTLINAFALDVLDLSELLRLEHFPPWDLLRFRETCQQEGRTTLEVLQGFIKVYPDEVKERSRGK